MVRRVLSLLTADVSSVHAAAYLLAVSALCSQLLALIRDRLLAHNFGAGSELDVYYAAFRVQDFIYFAVASLVSLAVLIPILVEKTELGKKETKEFLNSVFSSFFVATVFLGGLAIFFAPKLITILFPGLIGIGFDKDLLFLTRVLLLSPLILGLSNLLGSVTQAYKKFFIYALSPLLYNVGIIIGIIFFYPPFGLAGLAYGVILGALLHLAIQVPFIVSEGLLPRFTFRWDTRDLKRLLLLSVPRTFTLSLNHIAILVLVGLASLMKSGSISVLSFSFNLQSVSVSIIGASYSVAAFPILARHYLKKEEKAFNDHFTLALKHIIFWSFPALVTFIVLRAQIVRVVLGSGSFSWEDTRLTAASLALLSLSIVAQCVSLLFVRAFYAAGDSRKPLIISVISSLSIVASAYVFYSLYSTSYVFRYFLETLLRVSDVPGTEVLILPLAYSVGAFINVVLFWIFFHRYLSRFSLPLGRTALHSASASILMGVVMYKSLDILSRIFDLNTFIGIFLQGALSGMLGLLFLIAILAILKNEEFFDIVHSLHHKMFKKVEVVQTDSEV